MRQWKWITVLALTACTRVEPPTKDLVVALSAPPSTLDPRFATDATGSRIAGLLYSSFVRMGPDLKPIGEAALTWQLDPKSKGLIYTFKLRPLKFSDGRKVSDEDIDFSFETFRKGVFSSSFSAIESVHTKNLTTTIVLKRPLATFVAELISLKIIPQDSGAELPVGSGPFTLVSEDANDIRLKSRADIEDAPKISGVDFKIVRDDNTRVLKMQKGEVDLAQAEFPPMKIAYLEKCENLTVYKYPGLALTYLLFNLKDPFLAKKENRRAVASSIDVDSIIKYKLDGLATRATSLLTPINPYFNARLTPVAFKPSALVASMTLKSSSAPAAAENARLIAHDLSKVGARMTTQSFEWGTFYGDVQSGRFQLATLRWVGTIDPDLYRKALETNETPPVGRNRGSYSNSEVDKLTEQGLLETDFTKRKALYDRVQEIVFDEMPFVPLWYDTEVAVVNKRIKNYVPPKDGSFWIFTKVEKQ